MTEQQTAATDNALVEKLEREARLSESIPEYVMAKHACLLKQAAERIKSLKAEVQRTRDYWYRQGKDDAFETYEADRQRMREALEEIDASVSHGRLGDWSIALSDIRKFAREALANRGEAV